MPKQILFLNTYEIGLPIPDSIDRGFIAEFKKGKGSVKDLFIKHLDLARNPSHEYRMLLVDSLRHELAGRNIGLVIAEGARAVNFLKTEARGLCPGTQLLTLITPDVESLREPSEKIINVPWHIDVAGTLRAALDLFPKTRRVVVVTGAQDNILPFLEEARKAFAPWQNKLAFEYTNKMTYEQMLHRVSSLPPDSIIIYSPYFTDATGRSFVPADVVVKVCRVADAPVFSTLEPFLGHGIVGGSLLDTKTMGEQAARLALEYLHGHLKLEKPVTNFNASTRKMFDWKMLSRWDANIRALPKDSIVINRPQTLWGQYEKDVITTAAAFFFLCVLTLSLWILNRRLKRLSVSVSSRELHYRSLFENSLIGVTVTDRNSLITDTNDAFCRMLEYSKEELIGKKTVSSITHPDSMMESKEMISKLEQNHFDHFSIEKRYISKTGKIITALIYVRGIYSPVGDFEGTSASILDITEKKKADDLLRESNEKFTLAFNNAPIIISISKMEDGTYLDVNQRFIDTFGYSRDEVIGKTSLELGVITLSQRRQIIEVIKEKGKVEDIDLVMHTKSKKDILLKYWGDTITVSNRKRLLSISLDITEHRKIEQQLRQAQKMESVGRLAGGVAHDFNNMLGVILGHAEMAMEQIDPARPLFDDLEEIYKAASRSADLTRQLLAFARKQTIAPKIVDLNETIEGMLKMLRRLIGEAIDLNWRPATGLWPVKIDPSQIDQILANLCVNARDAIVDVGKIVVETGNDSFDSEYCLAHPEAAPGEYVRVSVSDTGRGMDKQTLTHIFEPFFTTKSVGAGTGLGLATVYGAVKQNYGFVTVYSEPGKGAIFTIYFPRYKTADTIGQTTLDNSDELAAGEHETILLVEDEPALVKMTTTMLNRLGYMVLAANTPSKAIHMADDYPSEIHLLITDVIMPEMNGRDLAEQLMVSEKGIKCLFMSGYPSDIIASQGVLDEGMYFIQKPFSRQALAAKIREVLDGKS